MRRGAKRTPRPAAILEERRPTEAVEAAGIEPASRDISTPASTCVFGSLVLVAVRPNRQGMATTSREQVLTAGVPNTDPQRAEFAAGSQTSSAKVFSRGYCY